MVDAEIHEDPPGDPQPALHADAAAPLRTWRVTLSRMRVLRIRLKERGRLLLFFAVIGALGAGGVTLFSGTFPGVSWSMLLVGAIMLLLDVCATIWKILSNPVLGIPFAVTPQSGGVHIASAYTERFDAWDQNVNLSPLRRLVLMSLGGSLSAASSREAFTALLRAAAGEGEARQIAPAVALPADMREASSSPEQWETGLNRIWRGGVLFSAACLWLAVILAFIIATGQSPLESPVLGFMPGYFVVCMYLGMARGTSARHVKDRGAELTVPLRYGFDESFVYFQSRDTVSRAHMETLTNWVETKDAFVFGSPDSVTLFPKGPWSAAEQAALRAALRTRFGRKLPPESAAG